MRVNIDRLRSRITERGYTIATLAEKATISESTLYRVLNGTFTPKVSTLEMIAAPLDVTVEWLISEENDSKMTVPVKNENGEETMQEAIATMKEFFCETVADDERTSRILKKAVPRCLHCDSCSDGVYMLDFCD